MMNTFLPFLKNITTVEAMSMNMKNIDINMHNIDNVWVLFCIFLLFIMHLGFAMLESGLTRAKNTSNVLYKNTLIPAVALLSYALCGYGLMHPNFAEDSLKIFGFSGFGIPDGESSSISILSYFLYQGIFAATAVTIISGAVAERVKLNSFIIFIIIFLSLAYPVLCSWVWGKGWLYDIGFHDFAGSTLVHALGGAAALAGVSIIGPRLGKFNGKIILPLPGHNLSSATIGGLFLWFGWIGFNGIGKLPSAGNDELSKVVLVTIIAGAAGAVSSNFIILLITKKHDLSMLLNGILAGLVSITAGADLMSINEAIIIGAIGGIIVVPSIYLLESMKLDDPVGAISVHLVCGFWGTIAVGIFGEKASLSQLSIQAIGVVIIILISFIFSIILLSIIKATIGLRVTKEQELTGLDLTEHGVKAYTFVSK